MLSPSGVITSHMTSDGTSLSMLHHSTLPPGGAGSVYWKNITSFLNLGEPHSTRGLNFFNTAIIKNLNFQSTKSDSNLHIYIQKFFHILHNLNYLSFQYYPCNYVYLFCIYLSPIYLFLLMSGIQSRNSSVKIFSQDHVLLMR